MIRLPNAASGDSGRSQAKIVAIVGPTATGKSDLAVRIALALDGEVVSGDSMQIYRGLDIGTAKIKEEERRGIPHHLLDLCELTERFSAAEYQRAARAAFADIFSRGKTPILVGGTGLYVDSALYPYTYAREDKAPADGTKRAIREALQRKAGEQGSQALWEKLFATDPASADRIHPHDTKRLVRALEYALIHEKPISQNTEALHRAESVFPVALFGLDMPRELLYARIDRRVDRMMEDGFLAEVSALRDRGLTPDCQAGQAIGYKQLLQHLEGKLSLAQALEAIKRESRRYAKRQLTWFSRNHAIRWLDAREIEETPITAQWFLQIC